MDITWVFDVYNLVPHIYIIIKIIHHFSQHTLCFQNDAYW